MGNITQRILEIQEKALNDEVYRHLVKEHANRNEVFLKVMDQLNEEQCSAIYDYFGVVLEMQYNMIILALESTSGEAAGDSKGWCSAQRIKI